MQWAEVAFEKYTQMMKDFTEYKMTQNKLFTDLTLRCK